MIDMEYAVFDNHHFVKFDSLEGAFAFAGKNFKQIKGEYEDNNGHTHICVPIYQVENSVLKYKTSVMSRDLKGIESGLTPSQVIAERSMLTKYGECNPCYHCQYIYDASDESVGLYGYGCDADAEWDEDIDPKSPCPCFRARLSSDSLFEQLAEEWEYQMMLEEEEERKKELEGDEE